MDAAFRTTCWTEVLQAAKSGEAGESAFAQFYRAYWDPLYAYVRRRGHSHSDAEEITQEFFVTFYTRERLARLSREGGRFRSFLLAAMQNFLANAWDKARAAKRGHGQLPVPIHDPLVELRIERTDAEVPAEVIYDREWGYLVLRRAIQALGEECRRSGKERLFETVKSKIQGDLGGAPYAQIAHELGITEGNLKVAVHRLRTRFGELLREEIARTVVHPEEVADELRHLLAVVSR